MQPDSPIGDRQAQTRSPGLAVAGIVEPVKGLKYLGQRFLWNAWTGIKHANDNFFFAIRSPLPLQPNLHRRAFHSIARGIPHHILHRAAEKVGVGFHQVCHPRRSAGEVTRQLRPGVSYSASCATCSTNSRSDNLVFRRPSVPDSSREIVSRR